MKLCRLNIQKDNSGWSTSEPDDHFDDRRTILVADDYDFNNNADEDVTEDVLSWEKHHKRLGVEYYHFLKIIQGILIPKGSSVSSPLLFDLIDDLTDSEKKIAVNHYVMINPAERIGVASWQVSNDEDEVLVENVIALSKESRIRIVEKIRRFIGKHCMRLGLISLDETRIFFRTSWSYTSFYIDTSDPIFKAYMTSLDITVAGIQTDFTDSGFMQEEFSTPENRQIIIDESMKIYNGTHYV